MEIALKNQEFRNKIHPKKFALWAACGSITMMFVAFTSAYVVRQAAGNWLEFELPNIFFINIAVILMSSVALQVSYFSLLKGNGLLYRSLLLVGLALGLAFIYFQYEGWQQLNANGIELTGNPSGSFIYVISGVHAAHVLGGIAAIIVALLQAFMQNNIVTPARKLRFEMTLTYWHFVGFLWLYLVGFFVLQQS